MLFGETRQDTRTFLVRVWDKVQRNVLLEPLEIMVRDVIMAHPEYQAMLTPDNIDMDYSPEAGAVNPFLHISLHLTLHEQISIDQPPGIRRLYEKALEKGRDRHDLEHTMMECLAEAIWKVQRYQQPFDEKPYLACLRKVSRKSR